MKKVLLFLVFLTSISAQTFSQYRHQEAVLARMASFAPARLVRLIGSGATVPLFQDYSWLKKGDIIYVMGERLEQLHAEEKNPGDARSFPVTVPWTMTEGYDAEETSVQDNAEENSRRVLLIRKAVVL